MGEMEREALASIRDFDTLTQYLEEKLDWPISERHEEVFFEYSPKELGIVDDHRVDIETIHRANIKRIRRLRSPVPNSPWGIFFVEFAKKRLPVVALRRILSRVTMKKRTAAVGADLPSWRLGDLLFIAFSGTEDDRSINFAHFTESKGSGVPTLKVLGWDGRDTNLRLDHVADKLEKHLRWPDDGEDVETWRRQWRTAFTVAHGEPIKTAGTLSSRLAVLAKGIRERVVAVLEIENEHGWVTKLMKSFEKTLRHGLVKPDFADMYAQTVAYGLLSARITDRVAAAESSLSRYLRTNPLLRDMLKAFLAGETSVATTEKSGGIDFDELSISEVVDLLNDAKMNEVLLDFRRRQTNEDPVVHFYESFLHQYDPKMRTERGVFYTPRAVVRYIVRSVDALLRSEFGLEDGLADTTTWGELAKRRPELVVPDEVSPDSHFVTVLDPATGTGTFLVEVIDCIHGWLTQRWKAEGCSGTQVMTRWTAYVEEHLLSRLYGYEVLMAPYAMAHLSISLKLRETGYRFGADCRANVYLTDALEPPHDRTGQLDFAIPALAQEAEQVSETKKGARFTIVLGNPPYRGHSSNKGKWITQLVSQYKKNCPELSKPGQAKWLSDDYVKFLRYGHHTIVTSGAGVLGFVTNHSYLDNKTFRGLRRSLMNDFDEIRVLDLHGNVKKGSARSLVGTDENVFDIQQGVAIGLFVRRPTPRRVTCVWHDELLGRRDYKGQTLERRGADETGETVAARPPQHLFVPRNEELVNEYDAFWGLPEIFSLSGSPAPGIVTTHDQFAISWSKRDAVDKIERLLQTRNEGEARELWRLCSQKQWDYERAKRELASGDWRERIIPILYRPFDVRVTVYDRNVAVHRRDRVMRHMLCNTHTHTHTHTQLAVVTTGQCQRAWGIVATRGPIGHHAVSAYDISSIFPLFLFGT